MNYYDTYLSPLGTLTISSDGSSITGLWMEGQKHFALPQNSIQKSDITVVLEAKQWLDGYFAGYIRSNCTIPMKAEGTAFQMRVWQLLQDIPYAATVTYGQIASALGKGPGAARAVGNAVGKNPISILIPCHRVIGSAGNTVGYAGGAERKIFLLDLEGNSA